MQPSEGPVVFLPGMNCSSRMWEPVIARLEAQGVTRELRSESLTGSSIEDCVDGLLERLPDRFAPAGLSLGGIVAMAMVRTAPWRVSRLCLMATNPCAPTPGQLRSWQALRERLTAGASSRQLQEELLPALLAPDTRDALEAMVLDMADEVGDADLASQLMMQSTRVDERAALAKVSVPTMIVAGGRDALCPVATHREMESLVPGSRLTVLPERGHLLTLEDPQGVVAGVESWLRT
ncbi:pimeloyl-ACP methyl ester carboxylesterase [Nesterenkonia xinjiangensis]|uniref:Pimeloyl-ACP methyl ester carboxylesterase n=1 Tax=Nesterenkonia xinjiangensis TaxID=225327 RepID=A0A7Z0GLC9_9MICC|nr:pimeloyl-ACP methyl ester carboxylesterase [Nesterenkonia xinjiangensis]